MICLVPASSLRPGDRIDAEDLVARELVNLARTHLFEVSSTLVLPDRVVVSTQLSRPLVLAVDGVVPLVLGA